MFQYLRPYFTIIALPPLFWPTLIFIGGIILYELTMFCFYLFSTVIITTLICFTCLPNHYVKIRWLPFILALGATAYKYQLIEHEKLFANLPCKIPVLQATIIQTDRIPTNNDTRYKTCLRIDNIPHATTREKPMHGKKFILFSTHAPRWLPDDNIELYNITIQKPQTSSYIRYTIKENLIGTTSVQRCSYRHVWHPRYSLSRAVKILQQRIFFTCKQKLSPQTFTLFTTIFMGNKTIAKNNMPGLQDQFALWGIVHYLARSGLHLIIFTIIWNMLFTILGLSLFLKQICLIGISSIYALLTWPTLSFMRAFLLFLFHRACKIARIPINLLHSLTIITFVILLFNPIQLFFLEFQLSFGLTFALAWLNLVMQRQKAPE